MPIYEYQCLACGKVCDHLVLKRDEFEPYCKHCGSKEVKKLISRVRVRLSLDTRIERLADPSLLGSVDENDPKSLMRLMDRMGAEFGSELGDEFDEIMDVAQEEIEEEMTKGPQEGSQISPEVDDLSGGIEAADAPSEMASTASESSVKEEAA